MPFISKDWRSPGEEWVRYEGGWERKKTISSGCEERQISSSLGIDQDCCSACCYGCCVEKRKPIGIPAATLPRASKNDDDVLCSPMDCEDDDDFRSQLQQHLRRRRLRMASRNEVVHEDDGRKSSNNVWLRLIDGSTDRPFCQITLKNTREVAGFNGLAEALIRLDFVKAITDVRRFNYVASLMLLLFSHDKLRHLPGAAQKILFRMLEVVADTVYVENRDQHVLRRLLEQLHATMTIYHVWGSHLGGAHLFKQHAQSRRKITEFVEKMQTEFKQDLAAPGLTDHLPEECIREILLRLSHHEDITSAGNACAVMNNITKERRIWRELVQTHFTKIQIDHVTSLRPQLKENQDWQEFYRCLRRRYGLREEFTEMLNLCRKCCALFWSSIGHPCLVPAYSSDSSSGGEESDTADPTRNSFDLKSELYVPVTPTTFLTFFSV